MKILHLYHDIMNLYGEYANVSALERMLEKSGVKFTTDRLTLFDNADLGDYDFIYIGSGTEKNQKLVLQDFKKYKDFLVEYINSGKVILMTGNSFEMLGKTITDSDGKVYDGLGIYDFTVTEQNKRRVTGDIVYTSDILTKPIVGFVNKCSEIKCDYNDYHNGTHAIPSEDNKFLEKPLFTVKYGLGNCEGSKEEGLRNHNLFATHVTGPIMIKNPHFLEYIALQISKNTDGFKPCTNYLDYERAGYEITLGELTKRFEE